VLSTWFDAALVASLAPGALWLGTRYETWRRDSSPTGERHSTTERPSAAARLPTATAQEELTTRSTWRSAALVGVAVVDGELLVELAPIGASGSITRGSEVMWLCGRADRVQINAAEVRCRSSEPVRYLEAEPDHVVLDVGALSIPLARPTGEGRPG